MGTKYNFLHVLFWFMVFFSFPLPLYALTAEEILNKKEYAAYTDSILKKYATQGRKRDALVGNLNALLADFNKIRVKAKLQTTYKMKIGTLAPEGTPWISTASDLVVPMISDISQGMMGITLYTGGVMGEDKDILRKMKMGQLHGCGCTAQGIVTAAPELAVFSLPFLFRNYKEVDYVLKKFRTDIESILDRRGLALFALIDTGYFYVFLKEKAPTIADLRKQKFLTWFGESERAFLQEVGITPIPLPVPEVVMSLRSGIINANIGPPAWQLGTQAYTTSNYFIDQPLFYSIAAIVLDKKALMQDGAKYGLTKKDTEDLLRLSIELTKIVKLEEVWNDRLREYERSCINAFIEHGMKPLRLSGEDTASLESLGRRVWDKLSGTLYPRDLKERIVTAIEEYRTKGGAESR